MKAIKIFYLAIIFTLLYTTACEDQLQEETFEVIGPSNFFRNADDAEGILNSLYANSQGYRDILRDFLTFGEMTTDIMIERGGGINANTQPVEDFEWSSTHPWLRGLWGRYYSAIYRANLIIDNVPQIDMDESRKEQIIAEARFLRALNYFMIYDLWGPGPLITSSDVELTADVPKAEKEEFIDFMVTELEGAADILPATQQQYGRATSGAALAFLTKFDLNNKNWQDAATVAKRIIDSNIYSIYDEGNRTDLFALNNERNNEFIFVAPFPGIPVSGLGNTYLSHAAPPGYKFQYGNKVNFAAQFKIRSEFLDSFEPGDQRLDAFVFEYENQGGNTVVLGENDVRSFKYPEDPNGTGDVSGNDFPLIRYADVILSRAEALNELNGSNQESIDLINDIRQAAGLASVNLSDFAGKSELRDFILAERGREFHTEGLRRQDLIRHGKFISMAIARGKPAKPYQVLFPIPQSEIELNKALEQNDGYDE